jgi:gliding motility associated protien GldN
MYNLFILLFFLHLHCFSQFCLPTSGSVGEGFYTPNSSDLNFVPFTPLREADVMWNKRIWRVIDLREKINHPLYFPIEAIPSRTSFIQMIIAGLTCNESEYILTGYDVIDDEFTLRLTRQEIIEKAFTKEEITFENEDGEFETKTVDNPFDFSSVKRIRIKEEWFFDNQRSIMDVRVIGICPVQEMFDEMGEYKGEKPMVWIYFPELRFPMSTTALFNAKNRAGVITYDHLFMKRMFSSYIYKRSNVFDRGIASYKQGEDLLLESKDIEHSIFEFEQDLWEY